MELGLVSEYTFGQFRFAKGDLPMASSSTQTVTLPEPKPADPRPAPTPRPAEKPWTIKVDGMIPS
jgi:hypothetical protein